MTNAERYNLQRGIKENENNPSKEYSIQSPLDAYVHHKANQKNKFTKKDKEEKELHDYIKKIVENKLDLFFANIKY